MEKTIKIGKTPVRLNNNIGWIRAYRSQFGHDILPTLMPLAATILDILGALISEDGTVEVNPASILRNADSDKMLDAIIHASGFEAVEIVNITWALAKSADPELDDPETWERQFEEFPLDTVVPAVWTLVLQGAVSSKNRKRLETITKALQPTDEEKKSPKK